MQCCCTHKEKSCYASDNVYISTYEPSLIAQVAQEELLDFQKKPIQPHPASRARQVEEAWNEDFILKCN